MALNLVICCDGTNNQFSGDHTNVIRMYAVAEKNTEQQAFYDPGVGTMPEPWETTQWGKRWSMLKGLAFGSGFLDNIQDAYLSLMKSYESGAQLFIFGFSRGAYTARALAGMLHSVGLLHPGSENLVPYALRYWQQDRGPDSAGGKVCAEFKSTLTRPCPVHFIGVWDTVGSVGFINNFRTFPNTTHNPSVKIVRHAVAIDERRKCFRQNLMFPAYDGQDIKNVWFAGVHSDIGGGYPSSEAGLASLTFTWMMREAQQAGLAVDSAVVAKVMASMAAPDCCGQFHESLKGAWWLVELIPTKRYDFRDKKWHWHFLEIARRRNVLATAALPTVKMHTSVPERIERISGYRPPTGTDIRSTFQIEN